VFNRDKDWQEPHVWLKFTGHSFAKELDSGWQQSVHPDDLNRLILLHREALQKRTGYETQYRLRRTDGQYRWRVEVAQPLYDFRNHFSGYMGGCFDVTDRVELQKELAGIGRLAAGVAHEINNPLAFVNSNIHSLKRYMDSLIWLSSLCEEIASICMHSTDETCRSAGQRLLDAKKT